MASEGAGEAFEQAEGDIADQQNQGNEERREIAIIGAEEAAEGGLGLAGGGATAIPVLMTVPPPYGYDSSRGAEMVCVLPEGQRISTRSMAAAVAQTEVQAALVLGAEAAAAGDFLHLLLAVPE